MRDKRHQVDMINGPIFSRMLCYAMPILATSVLQLLYNAADVAVVGKFAGEEALAAHPAGELGIVVQPQVQGRAFRVEFELFHSEDEAVNDKVWEAEKLLFDRGAFFDRPYGRLCELVYPEATQETELIRKMKKLFDPDGILNPGKLCF